MGLLRDMRESSNFEREFGLRKQQVNDLNSITPEALDLQIFVLKYDINRYFGKNTNHWTNVAHSLEGTATLYQMIIDEGIEKWSDKKFLKEQWEEGVMAKGSYVVLGDTERMTLSAGIQNGIAGLLEGQLIYDIHSKAPKINLAYTRAVKKWEAIEKEEMKEIIVRRLHERHGTKGESSRIEANKENKKEEYYDDLL